MPAFNGEIGGYGKIFAGPGLQQRAIIADAKADSASRGACRALTDSADEIELTWHPGLEFLSPHFLKDRAWTRDWMGEEGNHIGKAAFLFPLVMIRASRLEKQ
jgi:hypothetical protein